MAQYHPSARQGHQPLAGQRPAARSTSGSLAGGAAPPTGLDACGHSSLACGGAPQAHSCLLAWQFTGWLLARLRGARASARPRSSAYHTSLLARARGAFAALRPPHGLDGGSHGNGNKRGSEGDWDISGGALSARAPCIRAGQDGLARGVRARARLGNRGDHGSGDARAHGHVRAALATGGEGKGLSVTRSSITRGWGAGGQRHRALRSRPRRRGRAGEAGVVAPTRVAQIRFCVLAGAARVTGLAERDGTHQGTHEACTKCVCAGRRAARRARRRGRRCGGGPRDRLCAGQACAPRAAATRVCGWTWRARAWSLAAWRHGGLPGGGNAVG